MGIFVDFNMDNSVECEGCNGVQWILCLQVSNGVLQLKIKRGKTVTQEKNNSLHLPYLVPFPSIHVQNYDSLDVIYTHYSLEILGRRGNYCRQKYRIKGNQL